jgi:hypothetical protein
MREEGDNINIRNAPHYASYGLPHNTQLGIWRHDSMWGSGNIDTLTLATRWMLQPILPPGKSITSTQQDNGRAPDPIFEETKNF